MSNKASNLSDCTGRLPLLSDTSHRASHERLFMAAGVLDLRRHCYNNKHAVTVCLGLGTKTTWSGSGNDHNLG